MGEQTAADREPGLGPGERGPGQEGAGMSSSHASRPSRAGTDAAMEKPPGRGKGRSGGPPHGEPGVPRRPLPG